MTAPAANFFVLTGFLGSGKTTLLREFLGSDDAADSAVIVNEIGEIGLDGAILAETAGGLPIAQLANGCVCCSLGNDLARTIDSLITDREPAGLPPLRRIVLETSGLSRPGPILRSLAELASHRLRVEVVCTYDTTRPELTAFEEAAAQWAGAHTLVLTKLDAPGAMDEPTAAKAATALNPLARIVSTPSRNMASRAAFALDRPSPPLSPASRFQADAPDLHPRISVMLAQQHAPAAWDDVAAWLDNLAGLFGERLLRLKGVLHVDGADRPILVQSVGTLFSQPRPAPPGTASFLVVIARDVDRIEIETLAPALPLHFTGRAA